MKDLQFLKTKEKADFLVFAISKEKLTKICFKIIKWGTYLVLLTPLIYLSDCFHPFVDPKTFFFRIVVDVIFIAYILLAVSDPKYRPKITPLNIVVAVFLVVLVLASATGLNFERSFLGLFERGTGLLTLLHLFAFYIVLTGSFKGKKHWERILTVSIIICVFVSLSVLFFWKGALTRGGGTIGNSSFFSAYLLFNLFFAVIFAFKKTKMQRIFYGIALMIFVYSLFFNPGGFTRGAVAAFCLGAVIVLFGLLFYSGSKKIKTIALLLAIVLVLVSVVSLQFAPAREKALGLWRSNSVQLRLAAWQIFWQGWQERIWLGWGPENLVVPFAKHYDPQIVLSGDKWFDRAHNIILDVGVSSGIIGLLSYLFIFGLAFWGLVKKFLLKPTEREGFLISFIIIALLVAYFFQNLWVFDTISSYLMFFLSLAFINFLLYPSKEEVGKKTSLAPFIGGFFIILTVIAFWFGNVQPARASKLISRGMTHPPEQSVPAFQEAFEIFPLSNIEGSMHLSSRMRDLAHQAEQNKELINQGFMLAEEQLKKAVLQNPQDCRLYLYLGWHYNYFYDFSGDKQKLVLAEESLKKALELSPDLQKIYFELSKTKFLQGDREESVRFLQKAKELEPQYSTAIWYLIEGYIRAGKHESALSELRELEGLELNCKDAEVSAVVREVFKEAGQSLDVFIPLYEKNIEAQPKEFCFWRELICVYLEKGETEKADQLVEDFLELRPDFSSELKSFLEYLEQEHY